MRIIGQQNTSMLDLKSASQEGINVLYCKCHQKIIALEVMGASVLINLHILKLPSNYF